jgi:shikimate dehydrogenase
MTHPERRRASSHARLIAPGGETRVAGVIGDPIRHSLSPVVCNAAFDALGLDWVFVAFEVPDGRATEALDAMRTLGIDGLSVTMPHKGAVALHVDELTQDAAALEAVNCVARRGGSLIGHNTDGPGFLDALRLDEGWDPDGRRCVVVGAGGAARAVIRALAGAGAADVAVVNRTPARGREAARLAGQAGRVGTFADIDGAELIVNATPIGMTSVVSLGDAAGGERVTSGPSPVPAERLGAGQLVVDLVYEPIQTPLLAAARAAGATPVGGLGMLIHQAAHALQTWTGEDPPREVMSAAALAELARRAGSGGADP